MKVMFKISRHVCQLERGMSLVTSLSQDRDWEALVPTFRCSNQLSPVRCHLSTVNKFLVSMNRPDDPSQSFLFQQISLDQERSTISVCFVEVRISDLYPSNIL